MNRTWHRRFLGAVMLFVLPWAMFAHPQPTYAQVGTGGGTVAADVVNGAAHKQNRLSMALQRALAGTTDSDRLRVIVLMQAQTDLKRFTVNSETISEQGRAPLLTARQQMHTALRQTAAESQRAVLGTLQEAQRINQADAIRPFWLINAIALRASPAVIQNLAQRDDVASIEIDVYRRWLLQADAPPTPALTEANIDPARLPGPIWVRQSISTTTAPVRLLHENLAEPLAIKATKPTPDGLYGIKKIRADETWRELGLTGDGIVVANLDTGVDWQHPMLRSRYRGLRTDGSVDHLHSWIDATPDGALVPYDQYAHGTHVMGTIVGQDGIGVAPGAKWIAGKVLDHTGSGFISWIIAGMEWMYAPGGDTTYAPDVINNSWAGGDDDPIFDALLVPMRAAGILNVWANGNSGPDAKSVEWPAHLDGSFSVGASDSDDEIAYFSSRGPNPNGVIKPVVSAPGVRVVSTYPGGGYARYSGTSMATPHVTGAVALILQAKPTLSIAATIYALTSTAKALSTTVPNNESGYGRIDVYAAALSVISTGVITGQVLEGGQPISGALVSAYSSGRVMETLSDVNGRYNLRAPFGFYTATASAFGFNSVTVGPRLVITNNVIAFNFGLAELPAGVLRGRVRDAVSGAVVTATVSALGTPKSSLSLNSCPPCRYSLDLPLGTYVIEARGLGYLVQTRTITLADNAVLDMDFDLTPTQRIALVDSGAFYYGSQTDYYRAVLNQLHLPYDEFRVRHVPADVPTLAQLLPYDTVIWSAPRDSPNTIDAGDTISSYLEAGGNLLLTGVNIGYFDGGGGGFSPYFNKLNALLRNLSIPSRVISGTFGPLASKVITIAEGDGANNQFQVDTVAVRDPDIGGLMGGYTNDPDTMPGKGGVGIYTALCTPYHSAYFNFGLEAINNFKDRLAVISDTLSSFDVPRAKVGIELLSRDAYFTDVAIGTPGSVITHVFRLRHTGEAGVAEAFSLSLRGQHWPTTLSSNGVTLKPCATALFTVTTTIPITAAQDQIDIATVDVASPGTSASIAFTSKTPAHMLLVDDDRFYDVEQPYLDALQANGNTSIDRYATRAGIYFQSTPPLLVLQRYPLVIWFNGYDWFDPITTDEQDTLRKYLDGGGRLFFSSQAALQYTTGNNFDQQYLGVAALDYNDVISSVVGDAVTALGKNFGRATMEPFPYFWNLSTAVQPLPGSSVALRGDSGQPAALVRSGLTENNAWRTVFMPFAFETLGRSARVDLMNRVVGTLSWLGTSTFSAQEAPSNPGDLITYTLRLRADASMGVTRTHSVAISMPVSSGLTVISSTMANSTANSAGVWRGSVRPNDSIMWTFVARVGPGLATGSPLTASMQVEIEDIRWRFTRDEVVHVGRPILQSTLTVVPKKPHWDSVLTATLVTQNIGNIDAIQASISNVVPTGLHLLTDTLQLQGAGQITTGQVANVFGWLGNLAAGAGITMTYQISVPGITVGLPDSFYHAAQLNDGMADQQVAAAWLTLQTWRVSLPIVMRR